MITYLIEIWIIFCQGVDITFTITYRILTKLDDLWKMMKIEKLQMKNITWTYFESNIAMHASIQKAHANLSGHSTVINRVD